MVIINIAAKIFSCFLKTEQQYEEFFLQLFRNREIVDTEVKIRGSFN